MEQQELKSGWKVVSWIITAIVMFFLGMLGIVIADSIGSESKFFGYAGFFIGWSSYPIIKENLVRLTCHKEESNIYDIDNEGVEDQSSLNSTVLSNEQLLTHDIRVACQDMPEIWQKYIKYVSIVLGPSVVEGKIAELNNSNPDMSRDNIYELIGSEYAVKTILTDKDWVKELRSRTSLPKESADDVIKRLFKYIQITDDRINNATATEDTTRENVERLFAKVGARTIWEGMYQITVINQMQNNN